MTTRRDRYPETSTFHFLNANPKGRITTDCTFRAVALALGQEYCATLLEMAEMSCHTGYAPNDKKGIERYLAAKGWRKHPQPRKADNTKLTGAEFCRVIGRDSRAICMIGSHHITAVINGKVNDIWDCTGRCVGTYWTIDG